MNKRFITTAAVCFAAAILGTGISAMAADTDQNLTAIERTQEATLVPNFDSVLDENGKILDGKYHAQLDLSSQSEADDVLTIDVSILKMDEYNADDVHSLKTGDTIYIDGKVVTIDQIAEEDGCVFINGGFDKNGISLYPAYPNDKNTYCPREFDDMSTYEYAAEGTIAITPDTVLTDSRDFRDKGDVVYNGSREIKEFFETEKPIVNYYNTFLQFNNGELTDIYLVYTP